MTSEAAPGVGEAAPTTWRQRKDASNDALFLQIALSAWWLRQFRFGPVEWLWRSLSYGRRQPMRIGGAAG